VAGDLDRDLHHVDGTILRAHQHADGAQKGLDRRYEKRAVNYVGMLTIAAIVWWL
jgi:hypothetical protein